MTSWEYETGEPPSYDEISERFEEVSLDRALKRTSEIQEEYAAVGIGSILSHSDVYGAEEFRTTSSGLDFIAPEAEIKEMSESHEETWEYKKAIVYTDRSHDGEWMIAAIPMETCAFEDDNQKEFAFGYDDWEETRFISTDHGMIETVTPELGITSKMRRYLMQKENRNSFKKGDLIDMASMALRDQREGLVDEYILSEQFETYLNRNTDIEVIQNDFEDVLRNEDLEKNISRKEIDDVSNQVDRWFNT